MWTETRVTSKVSGAAHHRFDYICTFPGMDEAYGVKEQWEYMKRNLAGEAVVFHIEKGHIAALLSEKGFDLAEHLTPIDMEKRYLTLKGGSSAGQVNAGCCLALARVV